MVKFTCLQQIATGHTKRYLFAHIKNITFKTLNGKCLNGILGRENTRNPHSVMHHLYRVDRMDQVDRVDHFFGIA